MMSSFTNQYLIPSKDWFYLDLRSNLNNYDEFNYHLKLSRDKDFRSSGVIYCGVKEHQRNKSGIHAHLVVTRLLSHLTDKYSRLRGNDMEKFTSKIRDPYSMTNLATSIIG